VRLPNSEHESRCWRIEEIAPDFRLEDVWALPAQGGAEDFARLLELMGSLNLASGRSRATRVLFGVRHRLGGLLGWDDGGRLPIPGDTGSTLSARLPEDLRRTRTDRIASPPGFTVLYRTDVEWAAELSNRTVHAVMHLAWVDHGSDHYQGRLAVYVKPRGRLGEGYMALIAPFRHHIVYPAMMRQIERAWDSSTA
jgi:Protein of unknown function (DUF2867)